MVLADTGGPHHVWIRDVDHRRPLAFAIVYDDVVDIRREAAWRLERRLSGAPPTRGRPGFRPSRYQRHRLNLLLDILDLKTALGAQATSHEIAKRLVYRNTALARGREWKSSNERRQTLRLARLAGQLVDGGYRSLLRGLIRG